MKNRGEGQGEGVGEGLNREGGLINFPPLKRSWRDLFEGGEGGLIENLEYFTSVTRSCHLTNKLETNDHPSSHAHPLLPLSLSLSQAV